MPLTVQDTIEFDIFQNSKLIAGTNGLQREVTGIMVMEAPDIEHWGKSGEIILTSFFALRDFSDAQTKEFFAKVYKIGIAAIIVKMERLVQLIPDNFIEECNKYNIPLIKIPKETKYEEIITKVMETLINKNKILLDYYYDINQQYTKMALDEPKPKDIIDYLHKMIGMHVSLSKNLQPAFCSTDPTLDDFQVIRTTTLPKKKYTSYEYIQRMVSYTCIEKEAPQSQLVVEVPSLGTDSYQLIIHCFNSRMSAENFMVLENTVNFLQMELIKNYALEQLHLNHINELINDLILGRYHSDDEMLEILDYLRFNESDLFTIVTLDIDDHLKVSEGKWKESTTIALEFSKCINKFWKKYVSLIKKGKIIFIIANDDDELTFKEQITSGVRSLAGRSLFANQPKNISISSKVNCRDLPVANRQANNILKLLRKGGKWNKIVSYHDLGIYRLFLEAGKINELDSFIPDKIRKIEQVNPELNRTLKVFLDHNQNFTATADMLYIHPKTAKYRIERAVEIANIHLNDPEELLLINIGLRVLEFLK